MPRCLCALAWVLLVTVTAHAERLPIRVYTVEDGLAHARVRRIVRDPRGFLWFCTIDGLSRFDGAEFVTYRTADGLPDPWVTDLLTTRDGEYLGRDEWWRSPVPRHSTRRTRRWASGRGTPTVIQPGGIRGVASTTSGSRPAGRSRRSCLGGRSGWSVRIGQKRFGTLIPARRSRARRRWSHHC